METSNTPEWYIDAGGTKRGPYSTHQIEELFKTGQVHPDTVLYNSKNPENPRSVRSVLDLSASLLPTRPSVDLNKPIIAPGSEDADPDPTLSLFLTLQSTKHKKTTADSNIIQTMNTERGRFSETQIWFVGAMALIVGTLVWGTTKLLNYSSELGTKTEQPEAKPVANTAPPSIEHTNSSTMKKNLSDYVPKNTQIAAPKTTIAPSNSKIADRERERIREREINIERERQRQRDMEYERERELEEERREEKRSYGFI